VGSKASRRRYTGKQILLDDGVDTPVAVDHLGDAEVDPDGDERYRLVLAQSHQTPGDITSERRATSSRNARRSGAQLRGKYGGIPIDDRGPDPCGSCMASTLPLFGSESQGRLLGRDTYGLRDGQLHEAPRRVRDNLEIVSLAQGRVILAGCSFR
jgi:hypothetical protein